MQYVMRLLVEVVVMVVVVAVMGTVACSHARPNHTLTKSLHNIWLSIVRSLFMKLYKLENIGRSLSFTCNLICFICKHNNRYNFIIGYFSLMEKITFLSFFPIFFRLR